jgi:hypothetical protein
MSQEPQEASAPTQGRPPSSPAGSSTKDGATASVPDSKLERWLDATLKVVAALIGIAVVVIGNRYQQSIATSQLLAQRESGDTQIRAEMFKAITERLLIPPKQGETPPERDALLAELLALNFHEHIELKPLMLDLDDRLGDKVAAEARSAKPGAAAERQRSLRSIARRIRTRQAALLVDAKPANPQLAQSVEAQKRAGRIRYYGIIREGEKGSRCAVPQELGTNGCLRELMADDLPDGHRSMYVTVDQPDWKRERFLVSVGVGRRIVIDEAALKASQPAPASCRDAAPKLGAGQELRHDVSAYNQSFTVTWFDLPLTDNTLLADGTRYAMFIDEVCRDENDEPRAVRLGLLYFPQDYFPSRERPTNYRQLREMLGLRVSD